jgi:hypothetical protein
VGFEAGLQTLGETWHTNDRVYRPRRNNIPASLVLKRGLAGSF